MSESRLPPPPEETRRDLAARGAKGLADAIPFAGGILAEAVDFFWSPLRKRQEEWLLALWLEVRRLQEQRVLPADETLATNQAFVSATAHAVRVAATTHQQEKLEALRNAVLNVAAGSAPDEDRQTMFLHAIDQLTPEHMHLLRFLTDRPDETGPVLLVDPMGFPNARLIQVVRDLSNQGLIHVLSGIDSLHEGGVNHVSVQLTTYGRQFLAFITSPLDTRDDTSSSG